MYEQKIQCPKCDWEPDGGKYWQCDVCEHVWDTFRTGGKCPHCGEVYKETSCIACGESSSHVDWYRDWPEIKIAGENKKTFRIWLNYKYRKP